MAPSVSQEPATPEQRYGCDQYGETPVAPLIPQEPAASGHRGATPGARSGRWHTLLLWCRLRQRPGAGKEHSQPLEVFRTQVEHARALLAFGITEGRRYKDGELQITPELIEQILQAEDLLHRQVTPTWQERADFEKAYWHLTRALTPVTASLLTVPRLQQSSWFWVVMAGVYLGFAIFWAGVFQSTSSLGTTVFTDGTFAIVLFSALLSTTLIGFLWRFSYWFTGIVTRQKLNQIISFCYAFTLLAILSPVLMIGILLMFPLDLYRILALDSPIAITLGCSMPLPGEAPNVIPAEIRCGSEDNENYQWVVNVGGAPTHQFWPKEGNAKEFWRRPRLHINGGGRYTRLYYRAGVYRRCRQHDPTGARVSTASRRSLGSYDARVRAGSFRVPDYAGGLRAPHCGHAIPSGEPHLSRHVHCPGFCRRVCLRTDPRGDPCPGRETAPYTPCVSGEVSALRPSQGGIRHTL